MGFRKCALTLIVFFPLFAFSQNQDSLQQVIYKQALRSLLIRIGPKHDTSVTRGKRLLPILKSYCLLTGAIQNYIKR